ncbi:hypothetical protein [Limosilactobacillus reuteri]|uniref:hypothetical protein n=1 Tax=Limosilactobacillus reuteri TaxID=1598 RepID=UPI001E40F7FE|nr:hypothetical protein [Limosilactobacillus reuteri]
MNRINEILYLLMATNQAVVRVDKDDWKFKKHDQQIAIPQEFFQEESDDIKFY